VTPPPRELVLAVVLVGYAFVIMFVLQLAGCASAPASSTEPTFTRPSVDTEAIRRDVQRGIEAGRRRP
jgi:hypothetical protein